MTNIFSLTRQNEGTRKIFSWILAFSMLFNAYASAFVPLASAEVSSSTSSTTDASTSGTNTGGTTTVDNSMESTTTSVGSTSADTASQGQTETGTSSSQGQNDASSSVSTLVDLALSLNTSGSSSSTTSANETSSDTSNTSSVSTLVSALTVSGSASASTYTNTNTNTSAPKAKIIATKIVCDKESDLPNYGLGGPDITANTVSSFLANHPKCHLDADWKFQWGYGDKTGVAGVQDPGRDFVDEADGSKGAGTNTGLSYDAWKTFGPTNGSGLATVEIADFHGSPRIWVREVLKDGYIPFTFDTTHPTNVNTVSAELYCHKDVLNYDNYDFVENPVLGATYYCVAWNVAKTPTPPPPEQKVTVIATKIVCDKESDLPNWGITGPDVTSTTAANYVAAHPTCHLESGWKFQWGFIKNSHTTGVQPLPKAFVGEADGSAGYGTKTGTAYEDWKTFGPTDANGQAMVSMTPPDVQSGIKVREVLKDNYIPFSDDDNNNVSAEIHCYQSRNYNNYAFVGIPTLGNTYYCVAWNVGKTPAPVNQKPVITVIAPNPLIVTLGGTFTDPGATAFDAEDGTITPNIVKTGDTVNTAVVGTYTIKYNVKDSKGLAADEKTRTVQVANQCNDGKDNDNDGKVDYPADTGCDNPQDNDENNKPVITVVGGQPLNVTVNTTFTDPGATAFDLEDGTITPSIIATGTVNMAVVGTYTITYNVKDSKNLAADPKTRTVNVTPTTTQCNDGKDNDGDGKIDFPADTGCDNPQDNDENNKPVITIVGANPLEIPTGTAFTDLGATAFDFEDGTITPNIIATSTVNPAVVGTYTIKYNVKDSKGLAADEKTRTVKVVAQCADGIDNDADGKIDFPADTGCDTPNDNDENAKPVITVLGNSPMHIIQNTTFTDPGATAFDAEDGTITPNIIATGTVNIAVIGTYTITYNVKDSKNLAADPKTRTVQVDPTEGCTSNCGGGGGGGGSTPPQCSDGTDNDGDGLPDYPRDPGCSSSQDNDETDTGPVLTLIGGNPLTVTQNTAFTDPGATAHDPEEGDITSRIVATGTVNVTVVGTYTITYNVSDSQAHAATPITRTVNVVAPSTGCTANCGGGGCSTNCGGGGGGGGGPITLSIFNERLVVVSGTSVKVTWNTNLNADSRVVFGNTSVPTIDVAPKYGYPLTTATDTVTTTNHEMTITGLTSGATYHFRPVSGDGTNKVVGIELHLVPGGSTGQLPQECFYLREYLRLGYDNNPAEVLKLQTFLHDEEGFTSLLVTGFFDITTDEAVRTFQDRYRADVLDPWGLPSNTGYVYYTTQKKVNEIHCKRIFPLNAAQLVEVREFFDLLNHLKTEGGALPEFPVVGTNVPGGGSSGAVAGTSTGGKSPVAKNTQEESTSGRISLRDLLATIPSVGGTSTATGTEGAVAGAQVERSRGLAGVAEALANKMNTSTTNAYVIIFLIFLALILLVIYGILRSIEPKEGEEPKIEVEKFDVRK